ncbi:Gar1/Naf1 RNA binding region-domain-containing protein [Dipodascopsis uninucleata]
MRVVYYSLLSILTMADDASEPLENLRDQIDERETEVTTRSVNVYLESTADSATADSAKATIFNNSAELNILSSNPEDSGSSLQAISSKPIIEPVISKTEVNFEQALMNPDQPVHYDSDDDFVLDAGKPENNSAEEDTDYSKKQMQQVSDDQELPLFVIDDGNIQASNSIKSKSESDESSDSSSSSSSSSDEDEDDADAIDSPQKHTQKHKDDFVDDEDDEDVDIDSGIIKSKNEILDPAVKPIDIEIDSSEPIERLGRIEKIVGKNVIVTAYISGEYQVLDQDSILVFENREPFGRVMETLGPVQGPLYAVKFNSEAEASAYSEKIGTDVYYVPKYSTFIFTHEIKILKGSDASNWNDEEIDENEQEFSDDEAEAEFKRRQKEMKKRGANVKDIRQAKFADVTKDMSVQNDTSAVQTSEISFGDLADQDRTFIEKLSSDAKNETMTTDSTDQDLKTDKGNQETTTSKPVSAVSSSKSLSIATKRPENHYDDEPYKPLARPANLRTAQPPPPPPERIRGRAKSPDGSVASRMPLPPQDYSSFNRGGGSRDRSPHLTSSQKRRRRRKRREDRDREANDRRPSDIRPEWNKRSYTPSDREIPKPDYQSYTTIPQVQYNHQNQQQQPIVPQAVQNPTFNSDMLLQQLPLLQNLLSQNQSNKPQDLVHSTSTNTPAPLQDLAQRFPPGAYVNPAFLAQLASDYLSKQSSTAASSQQVPLSRASTSYTSYGQSFGGSLAPSQPQEQQQAQSFYGRQEPGISHDQHGLQGGNVTQIQLQQQLQNILQQIQSSSQVQAASNPVLTNSQSSLNTASMQQSHQMVNNSNLQSSQDPYVAAQYQLNLLRMLQLQQQQQHGQYDQNKFNDRRG